MTKPIVPSASLLSTLARALRSSQGQRAASVHSFSTTRTCLHAPRRTFSNTSSRTYKTVEEQKSRYKSGVRDHPALQHLFWTKHEILTHRFSLSRGKQVYFSLVLVQDLCFTFDMKRLGWRGKEWPRRQRVWDGPRSEVLSN